MTIAWLCQHISYFTVSKIVFAYENQDYEKTSKIEDISGFDPASPFVFITKHINNPPITIMINGIYNGIQTTISVQFKYNNVSIAYPIGLEREFDALEKQYATIVSNFFSLLQEIRRTSVGGKCVIDYSCDLIDTKEKCLSAVASCMRTPGFSSRWSTVFQEGTSPGTSNYYDLTFRRKVSFNWLKNKYAQNDIGSIQSVFFYQTKYLAISTDYKRKTFTLTIDKWLIGNLPDIAATLNAQLFEAISEASKTEKEETAPCRKKL